MLRIRLSIVIAHSTNDVETTSEFDANFMLAWYNFASLEALTCFVLSNCAWGQQTSNKEKVESGPSPPVWALMGPLVWALVLMAPPGLGSNGPLSLGPSRSPPWSGP
jgi:hypothetical protein